MNRLGAILLAFAPLSLLMFGGANAIIPEIHRQAVTVNGWMSDDEFATVFAVAQAAPGPNILVVSLIGWQVAGLVGLLVATVAINVPHCILTFGIGHVVTRLGQSPWVKAVKDALVPVTVGLILASGVVMGQAADHGVVTAVITGGTALFLLLTNRNPLWMLCAGTLAGLAAGHFGVPV